MDNIHTETMMRQFPGLVVCAMENGGMYFTDDGEFVDAADLPLDPERCWIDFENGDGAKGRIGWGLTEYDENESDEDYEKRIYADEPEDPPARDEVVLNGNAVNVFDDDTELDRLVAEQAEDDANTGYIATPTNNNESEEDVVETDELRGLMPMRPPVSTRRSGIVIKQVGDVFTMMPAPSNGTRETCSKHNRGRKPRRKDHFHS